MRPAVSGSKPPEARGQLNNSNLARRAVEDLKAGNHPSVVCMPPSPHDPSNVGALRISDNREAIENNSIELKRGRRGCSARMEAADLVHGVRWPAAAASSIRAPSAMPAPAPSCKLPELCFCKHSGVYSGRTCRDPGKPKVAQRTSRSGS